MKLRSCQNLAMTLVASFATPVFATIIIENGEIISGPGSNRPHSYEEADVEVVAAGGSGCADEDVYAAFLDANTLLVEFGDDMTASTYNKRIDRKFCNLTLDLKGPYDKKPIIKSILGVAKLKAKSGGQAEVAVKANFVAQRDYLEAEAVSKGYTNDRKLIKTSPHDEIAEPCDKNRPLNIKATTLARARSSSSTASAKLPKAVVLEVEWEHCYSLEVSY